MYLCCHVSAQLKAERAELAKRNVQIEEKDAEISRLNALHWTEYAPVMMGTVAQPKTAAAGSFSKKQARAGTIEPP
jgi:hypothetical protein